MYPSVHLCPEGLARIFLHQKVPFILVVHKSEDLFRSDVARKGGGQYLGISSNEFASMTWVDLEATKRAQPCPVTIRRID